jgi:hypothetical protein
MSLGSMAFEISGSVPGLDVDLARTKVIEAWHSVRKLRGWSFQLSSGGFSTPSQVNQGTVSLAFGGTTVTGDATASAAWASASQFGSLLTQRQFRIGGGTIYNIISMDNTVPTAIVLTLDRPYTDLLTATSGLEYLIYQIYYATPEKDFIRWLAVRDMTNVRWLNVNADYNERRQTDMADPQRQIQENPLMLLPFQTDQRAGSSTLGYFQYELYPSPIAQYAYQTWFMWEGPDLVNNSDELPTPITEYLVKKKALVDSYEWAEANKDAQNPRGAGADFRFLMGKADASYKEELKACRVNDRERVNLFNATMTRVGSPAPFSTFNPATGVLSVSNLAQTS